MLERLSADGVLGGRRPDSQKNICHSTLIQKAVHAFERTCRTHRNTANSRLPEDDAHEIQFRGLPSEKANLRNVTA